MTGILILLPFLLQPAEPMGGIYCDEVIETILNYQLETNAFTVDEIEGFIGRCEGWEEAYEEAVEAGEVEPINN